MSTGIDSTPEDPIEGHCHHKIEETPAITEAITTHATDKEDNQVR